MTNPQFTPGQNVVGNQWTWGFAPSQFETPQGIPQYSIEPPAMLMDNTLSDPYDSVNPNMNYSADMYRNINPLSQQQIQSTPTIGDMSRQNPSAGQYQRPFQSQGYGYMPYTFGMPYLDSTNYLGNAARSATIGREATRGLRTGEGAYSNLPLEQQERLQKTARGATGLNIASGILSGAKNVLAGMSDARRDMYNDQVRQQNLFDEQRRYNYSPSVYAMQGHSGYGYVAQDGGELSYGDILAQPLVPPAGQIPGAPVELERGEHAITPQGEVLSVPENAPRHSAGGYETTLQENTQVISDNIPVPDNLAKLLKKNYGLNIGKNTTFAQVLDQYTKKIGYTEKIDEQAKHADNYIKEQTKRNEKKDLYLENDNNANNYMYSIVQRNIEQQIQQQEPLVTAFAKMLFDLQEQTKQDPDYKRLRKPVERGMMADGGNTMQENMAGLRVTPERRGYRITTDYDLERLPISQQNVLRDFAGRQYNDIMYTRLNQPAPSEAEMVTNQPATRQQQLLKDKPPVLSDEDFNKMYLNPSRKRKQDGGQIDPMTGNIIMQNGNDPLTISVYNTMGEMIEVPTTSWDNSQRKSFLKESPEFSKFLKQTKGQPLYIYSDKFESPTTGETTYATYVSPVSENFDPYTSPYYKPSERDLPSVINYVEGISKQAQTSERLRQVKQDGGEVEQVFQGVVEMIVQGAQPQEIFPQLVQMGMDEQEATMLIEEAVQIASQMAQQDEMPQEEMMMQDGGYKVQRSSERKGKTHKVTAPDGTVKFFGDPNLKNKPNDEDAKKAWYARHKKSLDNNPHFRAYARETWQDGGEIPEEQQEIVKGVIEYLLEITDPTQRETETKEAMKGLATDGININLMSYIFPEEQMMQDGGQTDPTMQLIQMFAQISGIDPEQIMAELQQMPPEEAQQMLAQMEQEVMAAQQGQAPQEMYDPMTGQVIAQNGAVVENRGEELYNLGLDSYQIENLVDVFIQEGFFEGNSIQDVLADTKNIKRLTSLLAVLSPNEVNKLSQDPTKFKKGEIKALMTNRVNSSDISEQNKTAMVTAINEGSDQGVDKAVKRLPSSEAFRQLGEIDSTGNYTGIKDLTAASALGYVPTGQSKTGKGFYGKVTEEDFEKTKQRNPWFDWDNFNPAKKEDVLRFQKEYNQIADKVGAPKVREDGFFGEETSSVRVGWGKTPEQVEVPKTEEVVKEKKTEDTPTTPYDPLDTSRRGGIGFFPVPDRGITPRRRQLGYQGFQEELPIPYKVSPEEALREQARQQRLAQQQVMGMPGGQAASQIARNLDITNRASADAVAKSEAYNQQAMTNYANQIAQIRNQANLARAQQMRSYDATSADIAFANERDRYNLGFERQQDLIKARKEAQQLNMLAGMYDYDPITGEYVGNRTLPNIPRNPIEAGATQGRQGSKKSEEPMYTASEWQAMLSMYNNQKA